jgi:hypothetical protein
MSDFPTNCQVELPRAAYDLAIRLGASSKSGHSIITLTQTGRMKRKLGSASWMAFSAVQTILAATCSFEWHARFGPGGMVSVCDALQNGVGRLDVNVLGIVPIARTARTPALTRGELIRYLGELAWAPDAILSNADLRWREEGPDTLVVGTGDGAAAVEVILGLDRDGRIATVFAPDRPQSAVEPICPTPWRGAFADYRHHLGRWLPFAGEVAWEIGGKAEVYWQGRIASWAASAA